MTIIALIAIQDIVKHFLEVIISSRQSDNNRVAFLVDKEIVIHYRFCRYAGVQRDKTAICVYVDRKVVVRIDQFSYKFSDVIDIRREYDHHIKTLILILLRQLVHRNKVIQMGNPT